MALLMYYNYVHIESSMQFHSMIYIFQRGTFQTIIFFFSTDRVWYGNYKTRELVASNARRHPVIEH